MLISDICQFFKVAEKFEKYVCFQEGRFRWVRYMTGFDFTNWSPNEPNNLDGCCIPNANCLQIQSKSDSSNYFGTWSDAICMSNTNKRPLCQIF